VHVLALSDHAFPSPESCLHTADLLSGLLDAQKGGAAGQTATGAVEDATG